MLGLNLPRKYLRELGKGWKILSGVGMCFTPHHKLKGVGVSMCQFFRDEQFSQDSSHEKKNSYFPLNPGCLIGILIMVYYNPHITG